MTTFGIRRKCLSPVTSPEFRAWTQARMIASTMWRPSRIFKSAARSATAASTSMIEVRPLMNARRSAGSCPSRRYLARISGRQTAGVNRTSFPSSNALTSAPALEPRKYSIHAQESKVFMGFAFVSQGFRVQPRVRAEQRLLGAEQALRQDFVDRVGKPPGTHFPEQVILHVLSQQDRRLHRHNVYVNVYAYKYLCGAIEKARPEIRMGIGRTGTDISRHGLACTNRRSPSVTSKDNFEFAHEHRREVAWMSQNTNTLPVHPEILAAIRQSVEEREFNLYPRKAGVPGLVEAIQEDLGLEGFDVLLTNGGIEGEYIATRSFLAPGNEVLSTDPAFLPIHDQVAMSGARAAEVDIYRRPYHLTPEWASSAITPATKMLLLIDPNNPLGAGYARDQVRGLSDVARDHDLWLINDVTYRDFNKEHVLAAAFYPEQTLISYSFSKGPGLAGMRIGALAAPPAGAVVEAP